MATNPSFRARARFDSFRVDMSSGELFRAGDRVPIQEKPLQVLRLLLEAEGKVVTRDQLRSALWPKDTFVDFEHGVNTAVKKVRQALEDSADSPKFVETLPKFGYRFMVPVEWEADARSADAWSRAARPNVVPIAQPHPTLVPQPIPPPNKRKLTGGVAFIALSVIVIAGLLATESNYLSHTRLGLWLRKPFAARRAEPPQVVSQRRLTANPSDSPLTGGVLSPDGKFLAYTDPSGFYLRQVDGGETHPVPLPRGFDPLPESWFPDSAHLVVTWFGDQRERPRMGVPRTGPPSLWEISVLGGTPHKLVEEGSSARVSPDGSKIAFLTGPWDNEQIWLIAADGSGLRKIADGGHEQFGAVAWEPDGNRIACVRTISTPALERPSKQIEVHDVTNPVDASGPSEVILSDPRLGDEIAWANSGRLIYSLEEVEPNRGDFNLWGMQLEPRTGRPSGTPKRITNDRTSIAGISVALGGKRMALRRNSFQGDIYVTEVEAQGRRLSTPRRLTLDEREDWPTAWTPDNKAVLFLSDRDGPSHIFKQDIAKTQPELLVGGNVVASAPRLTPDGLSLLYLVSVKSSPTSDSLRLMRVPVSGGPSRLVLEETGISGFQCARLPATLCLYGKFEPKSEYFRFFTFDPDGREGKEILAGRIRKGEGSANEWSISPDGKYLVTPKSQNPYDGPALRVLDLAAGTEISIPVPDIGLVMGMDWAVDSKSLWIGGYMGRGAWGTRSGVLNVDLNGKERVVLEGLNPEIWFAIPSPDGHHLALMGNTQTSNMWLLENF